MKAVGNCKPFKTKLVNYDKFVYCTARLSIAPFPPILAHSSLPRLMFTYPRSFSYSSCHLSTLPRPYPPLDLSPSVAHPTVQHLLLLQPQPPLKPHEHPPSYRFGRTFEHQLSIEPLFLRSGTIRAFFSTSIVLRYPGAAPAKTCNAYF